MRIFQVVNVFVFVMLSMIITCGWALNDTEDQKTISGVIVDMDWVKSMIIVRYFDPVLENQNEINITVSNDTEIIRGTEVISLSGINQGDQVTVIYYDDGLGELKAKKISDLNLGNR